MEFAELIQGYHERSVALQWYWTVYILVIGGILGFSTFRLRPELATTILVTLLYIGFAYKNLGAIENTAEQREAYLAAAKDYPPSGEKSGKVEHAWKALKDTMPPYDIAGARNFHIGCDVLTLI